MSKLTTEPTITLTLGFIAITSQQKGRGFDPPLQQAFLCRDSGFPLGTPVTPTIWQ